MFASQKGVQRHFYDSPKHPKCRPCTLGFLDLTGLDIVSRRIDNTKRQLTVSTSSIKLRHMVPRRCLGGTTEHAGRKGHSHQRLDPFLALSSVPNTPAQASNSDHTSTPSSSLRLWSPSISTISQKSDGDRMTYRLSITAQYGDGASERTASSPDLMDEFNGGSALRYDEHPQNGQTGYSSFADTHGFQEASYVETGRTAPSEILFSRSVRPLQPEARVSYLDLPPHLYNLTRSLMSVAKSMRA